MKMNKLILVLALFPTVALATEPMQLKQSRWQSSSSYSHAMSQSTASSNAAAYSGGNTQSVNVAPSNQSVTFKQEKPVPDVYAPAISPTSPCMGSSSGGGSGTGFGLSFGTSWTDDECNTRETARMFSGMGLSGDALAVLCSSKFAQVAPSCAAFRPIECHADEIVAKRLGVGVCK
jgi:hypothetical protein